MTTISPTTTPPIDAARLAIISAPAPSDATESEHLKRCLLAGISVEWVSIPAIYDGEASSFRALRDGARVAWTVVS